MQMKHTVYLTAYKCNKMLSNIGGENVVSTRNVSDFVLIQFKTTSDFRIQCVIHWRFKNTGRWQVTLGGTHVVFGHF